MTKEYLDNLEKDLQLIIRDNFHPKHIELQRIAVGEECLEVIKFARQFLKTIEGDTGIYV